MKRIILVALSIAIAGTFAIAQAQEDASVPDCDHCDCETVDGECCCDGTVDGCTEDCDTCDECDCGSESHDCTECEEECTCDTECDDCTCEKDDDDEEEVHHCGHCH